MQSKKNPVEPPVKTNDNDKPKVRTSLPSTTLEEIARADGEGMAPVPAPRPEAPKPREQKSSQR
mgnify:CR=1 FL=1